EADRLPARDPPGAEGDRAAIFDDPREVVVVACQLDGGADGRIHRAVAQPRGAQRCADRGGEQWTDSDRPPGGCIETAEFAVVALLELSAALPEVEAFSAVLDALEDVPA